MYVIFTLNNEYYAFEQSFLKRFLKAMPASEPFFNKENLLGFYIFDKNVYSIIDTNKILGFDEKNLDNYKKSVYMLIDYDDYHIILPSDNIIQVNSDIELDEGLIDSCKYTNAIFRENEKVGIVLDIKELCDSCL